MDDTVKVTLCRACNELCINII